MVSPPSPNCQPADSDIAGRWLIELVKVDASPGAEAQPGSWNTYAIGNTNPGVSLPIDYTLIGILLDPLEVGRPVRVLRLSRNGIETLGLYQSSPVVEITSSGFRTRNSVYHLRFMRFAP